MDKRLDKHRTIYRVSIVILGIIFLLVIYQITTRTLSPEVEVVGNQDFITLGDELAANFNVYNPNWNPRLYTYAIYLDDDQVYENTITIQPKRDFVFGGQFKTLKPGKIKVTALVYEGDKEQLVENITYYVSVEPKDDNG
jgi:hypothetical protein